MFSTVYNHRSNRMKDKIIVVLIVLMFLEAIVGYCGFVWYESQFRSRRVYHTNVATDTGLFVVSACELCKTGFNFSTIPA